MMKKIIFALTFVSMIAVVNQSFAGNTGGRMRPASTQSTPSTKSTKNKINHKENCFKVLGCLGECFFTVMGGLLEGLAWFLWLSARGF
jgi:hypothetical protein